MSLKLVVGAAALAVALAEAYRLAGLAVAPAWLAAALVNSVLAFLVGAVLLTSGQLKMLLWPRSQWRYGLPAAVVLGGSLVLAALSRQLAGAAPSGGGDVPLSWLVWIPLVEELVFRAGIGRLFRQLAPPLWAAWFSAAAFALVHASPTLSHLATGQVGLPFGPFLLGLCCEALLLASGSLVPGILLHAACNATVVIFTAVDPRWLDWLSGLYQ